MSPRANVTKDDQAGMAPADAPVPPPPAEPAKGTTKKAPGRPRGSAGDKAPRGPGRPTNDDVLTRKLTEKLATYLGIASVAAIGGDPTKLYAKGTVSADLKILADAAEPIAVCLVHASKTNRHLRTALEAFAKGTEAVSVYGVLLTSVVLPILANHDLLPEMMVGLGGLDASTSAA